MNQLTLMLVAAMLPAAVVLRAVVSRRSAPGPSRRARESLRPKDAERPRPVAGSAAAAASSAAEDRTPPMPSGAPGRSVHPPSIIALYEDRPNRGTELVGSGDDDETPPQLPSGDRTPAQAEFDDDRTPMESDVDDDRTPAQADLDEDRTPFQPPERPPSGIRRSLGDVRPREVQPATAERSLGLERLPLLPAVPIRDEPPVRYVVVDDGERGTRPRVIGVAGTRNRLVIGGRAADIGLPSLADGEILLDLAAHPPLLLQRGAAATVVAGEIPLGDLAVPLTAGTALLRIGRATVDLGGLVGPEPLGPAQFGSVTTRARERWQVSVGSFAACAARAVAPEASGEARRLATTLTAAASPSVPDLAASLLRLGSEMARARWATTGPIDLVVAGMSVDAQGAMSVSLAGSVPAAAWPVHAGRIVDMIGPVAIGGQASPVEVADALDEAGSAVGPGDKLLVLADPLDVAPGTRAAPIVTEALRVAALVLHLELFAGRLG